MCCGTGGLKKLPFKNEKHPGLGQYFWRWAMCKKKNKICTIDVGTSRSISQNQDVTLIKSPEWCDRRRRVTQFSSERRQMATQGHLPCVANENELYGF